MTEVLLFNQYFTSEKKISDTILASMPINLLYLASYLKEREVDSKIYELGIFDASAIRIENNRARSGISDKEIMRILENEKPKIIGLGCMYSRHYIDILAIARLIKSFDSSINVVLGGNHATVFYDMVLKNKVFDFVVRGEGEVTFYDLCKELLSSGIAFMSIPGLAFRNHQGEIVKTPQRKLIGNLDELTLDYTLIDVMKYANPLHKSPFLMRYPAIGITSSRGCPGNCVYCTVKAVWGRTWRPKSVNKTVDEIELLHNQYGIREFVFLDDNASLDKNRWSSICDEIIGRKLDIRWTTPNGIAHWTLDKVILQKMKAAGCYRVTFGIESGNNETRKFLGKPYSLLQATEMIQWANRIGMWTICTNILGFPYETMESMQDTVRFAKTSGTDFATFYILAPHLTSDVYSYFKKEGLLNFDSIFNNQKFDEEKYEEMNKILDDGGIPTKYFSPEEIKKIQMDAYRSFILYRAITFLNLLRLLRKIHSKEDLIYTVRLVCTGLKILRKSFYKTKTTKALLYG